MKKQLLLVVFTFFATLSFGQRHLQDVIYLKDGGIIRGLIIEEIPNESLKIKTAYDNVFVYSIHEIEKISKEKYPTPNAATFMNLGMQFGIGDNSSSENRLEYNVTRVVHTRSAFLVGLGTGFRFNYDNSNINIPVFADLTANFNNGKHARFLSLNLGYSVQVDDDIQGDGIIAKLTTGSRYYNSVGTAFLLAVGFEIQEVSDSYFGGWGGYQSNNSIYTGISMTMGVSF